MILRLDFALSVYRLRLTYLRMLPLLFCCALPVALAGTTVAEAASVAERFPAGSIASIETADRALSEVEHERAALERRYAQEEQACYGRFFASSCLDTAKEHRRISLSKLRPIEVEANMFKRRARVAERDEALREKQPGPEPAPRVKSAATPPPVAEERAIAASPRNGGAAPISDINASARVARHNAKLRREQQEEEAEAKKRAESEAAYQRKREESLARQRELENRKQEKARERDAKQVPGAS